MITETLPAVSETMRLRSLRSYDVLDTMCEASFDNIVDLAARLTECKTALVSLIDADRQWFKARRGMEATEIPRQHAFCAEAIRDPGQPMIIPDARRDRRFADNPLVTGEPGIRFYAGMPLVSPEGAALGTLCIIDNEPRELTEEHLLILRRLAEMVMTTLELRRAMKQVRQLASTDMLTGLSNRAALLCAVDQAIAEQNQHGGRFALLYLDLDGLKRVNDQNGHRSGDAVLQDVGATLQDCLCEGRLAARLGGDEFAMLLTSDGFEAASTAELLRTTIQAAMLARGCKVTASVGAVTFTSPPADIYAAIAAADAVMYEAKSTGNRSLHRLHGESTRSKGSVQTDRDARETNALEHVR